MHIKSVFITISMIHFGMCLFGQIQYPRTKKVVQEDNYFGTKVGDPYRWLENDNSAETKSWVDAENKITEDYLAKIPFRALIKKQVST